VEEGEETSVDEALPFLVVVGNLDIVSSLPQHPVDVQLKFRRLLARSFHLEQKRLPAGDGDEQIRPSVLPHGTQLDDHDPEVLGVLDHFFLDRGLTKVSHDAGFQGFLPMPSSSAEA
jgi:hypothetical protein